MASKHTRVSRRMLFTWFMLGGLILLFAPQEHTGKIQLGFVRLFRWPLSIGGDFALTASTDQMLSDTVPRIEHEKLQIHLNNLQATLTKERQRSRNYRQYNDNVWEGADIALAKIIAPDVKEARDGLTINYSKDVRLVKGQFVLGHNSVIGRISEASAGTAHVRLFTDPKSAIPVKIGELGIKMWLRGNGDNSASISLVKTEHAIKAGDIVFASDVGTTFLDAPVMIGKVARCVQSRKAPLVWDITVEPACDLEDLVDVAVIVMNPGK
ncbi:MAG: rod shape-determining protein MreC [Phycisphaerales bacterium]|nr:MAG: rod shape-determining protein MreC [Phycisphaerales bacterium]